MNPPRGPGMGTMGPGSYGPGMRGPPPGNSMGLGGPGGPPQGPGGPGMPPFSMAGPGPGGRPQWTPNTCSSMTYSSSSPGNYVVHPGSTGPPGPGWCIFWFVYSVSELHTRY